MTIPNRQLYCFVNRNCNSLLFSTLAEDENAARKILAREIDMVERNTPFRLPAEHSWECFSPTK